MTDREFLRTLVRHGGPGRRLAQGWMAGLTEEELLRCVLVGEAEAEPNAGQEAICWVIHNRVADPGWWGSTPFQVMLWPHQFSCLWSDFPARRGAMRANVFRDNTPWAQLVRTWFVEIIQEPTDWSRLRVDPTGGATHYWNPAVCSPPWAGRLAWTIKIGHHQFGREV